MPSPLLDPRRLCDRFRGVPPRRPRRQRRGRGRARPDRAPIPLATGAPSSRSTASGAGTTRCATARRPTSTRSWPPTPSPPPSTAATLPLDQVGMLAVGTTLADLLSARLRVDGPRPVGRAADGGAVRGRHLRVGGRRPPARLDRRHGRAARGRRGRRLRAVQRHDEGQPLRAGEPARARAGTRPPPTSGSTPSSCSGCCPTAPAPSCSSTGPTRQRCRCGSTGSRLTSYAGTLPTCMFLGSSDPRAVAPGTTWLSRPTPTDADHDGMLVVG